MARRPIAEIATDILRDPQLRGRARMFAPPHLEILTQARSIHDVVGYKKVSMSTLAALDCLRTYKNQQLKGELLDHLQSQCRVM